MEDTNRARKVVYVKKWFTAKEWELLYRDSYVYLAGGDNGSRLYAFLVDYNLFKDGVLPNVEKLTESEQHIVDKYNNVL
jgi:hypothetical protein